MPTLNTLPQQLETPIHAAQNPPAALRVLHVINGEHFAGAERVQDLLALRLPDYGVNVSFACVKPDRFPAARRSQSTPLFELSNALAVRSAGSLATGPIDSRSENFDLIHTHTPRSALVGSIAARLTGVPLVHHVHGQTVSEVGRSLRSRLGRAG